jgi:general secretion pathway protein N
VRLDDAGPRTWLLAALAGWAVLLWLLALAGMGGRITPLPDDPALVQRLPQPASPAPQRLGPLAQYAEIGARPLFSEDRKPQPFSLQPEGEQVPEQEFDYVLTGVLLTPSLRMAILQPAAGGESLRLKVGEALEPLPAWRLVALLPRSAVFEGPEGERALDLRSYDGTGGAPPTAMRAPDASVPEARMEATGAQPAAPVPASAADPVGPPAQMPTGRLEPVVEEATATPESQMEAIRKRVEARRAQLRREAQQEQQPPANR